MTTPATPLKRPRQARPLLEIAERFGTPTYVYEVDVLRERARALLHALKPLPRRLLYAMKANSCPALLREIAALGFDLEAVSPGEVELALRVGIPANRIFYSANNMTDQEMAEVAARGILFNIGELSRLDRFGGAFPGSRVSVRLNPELGAGHHRYVVTAGKLTKFGVPVDQIPELLETAARYDLRIVGLHQHIGSGIADTGHLRSAIEILLTASQKFKNLEFLDFGGGLNVPYRPGDVPLDIENLRSNVVEPLLRFSSSDGRRLSYWFEPGRYLVAECGTLITRVNTIKRTSDRTFAGTDTGFNHLIRPVLYGAYHAVYNLSRPEAPLRSYDVVGNICESGDVFAQDRHVQEIQEGDVLAILDAGAYGIAMASEYNLRPLPAEVVLYPDGATRQVRARMSSASLVSRYLAEGDLHEAAS